MNEKRNYQKELDRILDEFRRKDTVPSLLLHSCCAPCSSYVLEYLSEVFSIRDFFYNPNISPEKEYRKRAAELERLVREMPMKHQAVFLEGDYEPEKFRTAAEGLEKCPEGGERCFRCYELRLRKAAEKAGELGCDFFATTLTISPLKNAEKLNEIGEKISRETGIPYLVSDFKKKNGYKRSIELSKQYSLYRQNFCGCIYSKTERMSCGISSDNR